MDALRDWSSWLTPGHFLSFFREGTRIYEHVVLRDIAHWEYEWPEEIATVTESGPFVPDTLEITRGFNKSTKLNRIWQMIFGINKECLVYVELPTDLHRHGIPKEPKPSSSFRLTSHFTEWMSPFYEPSFCTEHFMVRPETQQIAFSVYNTNATAIPAGANEGGLKLNIFINKMITERIGEEIVDNTGRISLQPTQQRWNEVLDKLYRRVIPHRPISILPVRAPAEAPVGE